MWRGPRRLWLLLSAALLSIAGAAAAAPNSEGLGKPPIPVSFLAHHTDWIDILYPPSARDRVAPLFLQAEDVRAELAELLGQPPLSGVEVRVARGAEEIATLAPLAAPPRASATGIAYPGLKLVILSLGAGGEPSDLEVAFRRELAHVALSQATAGRELPGWFTEGLALHFSGDKRWARWSLLLRASVRHGLVLLAAQGTERPADDARSALVVSEGADFVAWLVAPERRTRFPTVTEALHRGSSLADAIAEGYGAPLTSLESAWQRDLARRSTVTAIAVTLGLPLLVVAVLYLVRTVKRRRARAQAAKALAAQGRARAAVVLDRARVHIVLSRREEHVDPPVVETDVPKVEDEGGWHTLH